MKPKIKKVGNKWLCYTNFSVVACGDSPETAYNRWMELNDNMANFTNTRCASYACNNAS